MTSALLCDNKGASAVCQQKFRTALTLNYLYGLNSFKQHYHILQDTEICKEAFPQPPIFSYRTPKNLRDHLVRAKLKGGATSAQRGSYKCNSRRHCNTCSHKLDGDDTVTFTNTNKTFTIKQRLQFLPKQLEKKLHFDTFSSESPYKIYRWKLHLTLFCAPPAPLNNVGPKI